MQLKGSVADVWSAELDKEGKHEDKIVMVETDQGQSVIADLGHTKNFTKDVEEGTPAIVTGQMMTVDGRRRFVPANVEVGAKSASTAAKSAAQPPQAKQPEKRQVSGKVVAKGELNAKQTKVDHDVVLVEVDDKTRVVVDLGSSEQLKNVKIDKGDRVRVEGQEVRLHERAHGVVMADSVEAGGQKVEIQREAIPATGPAPSPNMNPQKQQTPPPSGAPQRQTPPQPIAP
jgi:hypothetical protein